MREEQAGDPGGVQPVNLDEGDMDHDTSFHSSAQPLTDLTAARTYLHALSTVCREGATSPDPRVTSLALSLVARQAQELAQ